MTMARFVQEINNLSAALTQNMADYVLASSRVEMSTNGGVLQFQPEGKEDTVQIRLQSEVARKAFTQLLAADSNAAVTRILHTLRELQCMTNDAVEHVVNAIDSINGIVADNKVENVIETQAAEVPSRLVPIQSDAATSRRVRHITSPVTTK